MRAVTLYTIADSEYFESFERLATDVDYKAILSTYVPSVWTLKNALLWYHASSPEAGMPASGFKLHISATIDNAQQILSTVIPICVAENVNFKVIRASNLLALANSKLFPRFAAHKFITIYPATTEHFIKLARALDTETRSFIGPYILSDRPVNGSRVIFYRFGGFKIGRAHV